MKNAMNLLCKLCLMTLMLLPISAMAQGVVKGTVLDGNNEPIIGASVVEKGNARNGAVTDLDGKFTLKLQQSKTAVISYIGMISKEINASESDQVVVLEEEQSSLDEIVVLGYTSRARKDLTGSVGSISGAKLAAVPVASAAEALQGKIAGVQVTSVDGQPGADINIRVRGATSVTQSNEPLYIVDGFQQANINDIPPSDIASIDVLKDASLTAVYGAKGGNGVIVVTTKSAQAGRVTVGFNGRLSYSKVSKKLDLLNTADFVDYQYDRAAANGTRSSWAKPFRYNFGNPGDLDLYHALPTHDWQDEVLGETPINYSANVTVGGGTDKLKFNVSLTQTEDKGIILGSGVRRTNLNVKLAANLTKNLVLTFNPRMTYRRDVGGGGSRIGSMGLADVLRYRPTNGLREAAFWAPEVADPDEEKNFEYTNPKSDIETNQRKKHSYNINNQFALQWTPIKGLVLRSEGNYAITIGDEMQYYGPLTKEGQKVINQGLPVASISDSRTESYTWTNTASYSFTLKDMHNFSFLLGQEIYHSQKRTKDQTAHLFSRDVDAATAWNNMNLGTVYALESALNTPNRMASFFGQANYNYDHKYLLSVTMRADGSTKFAPGNQWGYFPSISGAWDLKRENFLKDVEWIDQLKFRAAFGLAGNNNIDDDMWRYLYTVGTQGGPGFGEVTKNGELFYTAGDQFPNKDVKWETTVTRNFAFDLSFFGNRLTITPELYFNTTRDLLYKSTIPSVSGYTAQMQNIGKVTNNGFELTVNGDILRGKDYVLSGNLTFGMNKMTIKKLNATDKVLYNTSGAWKSADQQDYKLEVGGELGLFYGYVYDGLYSPDEFYFDNVQNNLAVPYSDEYPRYDADGNRLPNTVINKALGASNSGEATLPGKIKLKDLNGDGIVDQNDKTVIGNSNPEFQGGFGLSGQWKNFDFTANFTYMVGFDVYNATAYALSSSTTKQYEFHNVLSDFADNRWRYVHVNDGSRYSGECMYKNHYLDNSVETYIGMNANASLWNPADLVTNALISNFVEDGSFIRCSDVTIGYTLPETLTKKWGMNKLRVYASASNLFILTDYSGFDPEVDVQSGLTPSMDYNRYPRNRQFSLGVNVTF
ncbi:MAG: TonB-dependent receptor [Prevotella sp.]|nr:TonB-dependent receptor [Prevotella sp.]